jgi:hypothetical protein
MWNRRRWPSLQDLRPDPAYSRVARPVRLDVPAPVPHGEILRERGISMPEYTTRLRRLELVATSENPMQAPVVAVAGAATAPPPTLTSAFRLRLPTSTERESRDHG